MKRIKTNNTTKGIKLHKLPTSTLKEIISLQENNPEGNIIRQECYQELLDRREIEPKFETKNVKNEHK